MKMSMHLKIVKVKQITKPKKEVLDSKQALYCDSKQARSSKEEVSRSSEEVYNIFSNSFTTKFM